MPALTRWVIKSSLIFFVAAPILALALAANSLWELPAFVRALGPVYFHLFMVGWVTQLIFGVVFWMFPKHSKERPRGSEALGWLTFGLLNAGLLLRLGGEPAQALDPAPLWGRTLAVSAVLQWAAGG